MSDQDLRNLSTPPELGKPPTKVVSLVPSMTESLFELGFGESVIGITDFCIYPAGMLTNIQKVGGPKNPDIDAIVNLAPDLVFANQEENTLQAIQQLVEKGIKVWASYPRTVDDALDVLRTLLGIYHTDAAAMQITSLQMAYDWARNAVEELPRLRYFCPIWQDKVGDDTRWWMTFNDDTYTGNLIGTFGLDNIFAKRERKYPLEAELGLGTADPDSSGDKRYPRVTLEEIISLDPELIILPSEPFAFDINNKVEFNSLFSGTTAVKQDRVILVDGSLITWHGTRLAKAINQLPSLLTL
ncbi:MAG: helical backbone metal receptor [Chloroflexota bacterium]